MFTLDTSILPIEPKDYTTVGDLIKLPVYNDLLGMEYEELESIENEENEWNTRLLELANKVADEKGIDIYQVSELLSNAENAGEQEKMDIMGSHLLDFNRIISERPAESQKVLRLAKVVLTTRVNPELSSEDVKKLPRKIIQGLYDFLLEEQSEGEFQNRAELERELKYYRESYERTRPMVDVLMELKDKSNLNKAQKTRIDEALAQYSQGEDQQKKT